jgi:hypothetical protein
VSTGIRRVAVVIPSRDEADALDDSLTSVVAARAELLRRHDAIAVDILVVLDSTGDESHAIARRFDVAVAEVAIGRVGAVRDHGVRASLAQRPDIPAAATLAASTDADSRVPADWLIEHVRLADAGADLVVGTVRPNFARDAPLLHRWLERHTLADGHPHVHGANLSIRGDLYLAIGGFCDLAAHEDVALVDAARRHRATIVATGRAAVSTSERLVGRVDGGFATYLSTLTLRPDETQAGS